MEATNEELEAYFEEIEQNIKSMQNGVSGTHASIITIR